MRSFAAAQDDGKNKKTAHRIGLLFCFKEIYAVHVLQSFLWVKMSKIAESPTRI